jgi:flagellar biosynthesis protein FlhG
MSPTSPSTHSKPRLVAFASGKGGVGKTVCTANLALHLADHSNVLSVDLDLGCGNLNASLGVRVVPHCINEFLDSTIPELGPLKTATARAGLQLICCSYNPVVNTALTAEQKVRLLQNLRADDSDYVLIDLGAGVTDDILDLFASADIPVLVTGPESLALHNAYVFVKSIVYRVIAISLDQNGIPRGERDKIVRQLYDNGDTEIRRTIEAIAQHDRAMADFIRSVVSGIRIHLILNKVQDAAEERYIRRLQDLTRKYVSVELSYLGYIPFDDNIKKSLNSVVPFALEYKLSPANIAFGRVAKELQRAVAETTSDQPESIEEARSKAIKRLTRIFDRRIEPTPEPQPTPAEDQSVWLEEKKELERTIADLNARLAQWRQRQTSSEKKLEESLVLRDQFIERMQNAIEQQTLRHRAQLEEKDARIAELEREIRARNETIPRLEETPQSEGIKSR